MRMARIKKSFFMNPQKATTLICTDPPLLILIGAPVSFTTVKLQYPVVGYEPMNKPPFVDGTNPTMLVNAAFKDPRHTVGVEPEAVAPATATEKFVDPANAIVPLMLSVPLKIYPFVAVPALAGIATPIGL
jgi:hypothetical protein